MQGLELLLQLDVTLYPINIMRMNHRVALFLMLCADSIIAQALLTFLIIQLQWNCPTTIFNCNGGNHLRPIFQGSLLMKSSIVRRLGLMKKATCLSARMDLGDKQPFKMIPR